MKRSIYFFLILAFYLSCTCEDNEAILLEEDIPNSFLVDSIRSNTQYLTISFNKPLDQGSVVLGESLLLRGDNSDYGGQPIIETQTIRLLNCDFFCDSPPCMAEITLSGADGGIKSMDNQLLDGDKNGTDGGDFFTEQDIIACSVPCVLSPSYLSTVTYDFCPFNSILTIPIVFNEAMDTTSINGLNLMTKPDDNNSGSVDLESFYWSQDATQLYLSFVPINCHNCLVDINLLNDQIGIPPVISNSGIILDGDKDGLPGGDYTSTILINETPAYVVSPEANQIESDEYILNLPNGFFSIDVKFSQPIDTNTVDSQSVSLTYDAQLAIVPLFFTWNQDQTILTVISQNNIGFFCTSNCFYTLRINEDNGIAFVTDQSGLRLDGDRDCEPGGLYTTTFFY